MAIMIHACPAREWYVNDYLVPSLLEQGIKKNDITVWMDRDGAGNLASCIDSFFYASQMGGETWHLQDDVIISSSFAKRTRDAPPGIVCGFCVDKYEEGNNTTGQTIGRYMWQSSFPCIKIPDALAGAFVNWYINEAQHREDLRDYVESGKKDDTLFYIFILEKHFAYPVTNMDPHLVDHVDYIIGGSIINQTRGFIARSSRFHEPHLIEELREKLASH